ncbi:MAG: DNA/RNA nuclease SfsA, partial [Holosporaceae bacterium]|nr:DNA/RNA nuclease SfsA [Holosporaceae bacterium]
METEIICRQSYKFDQHLERGTIISRPNRFLTRVEKDGDIFVCHCPSTGKIGNIIFDKVPCLLSKSSDEKRKTPYTVETISIDGTRTWVGINQNAANRYVEYFFRIGALDEITPNGHTILREQKVENSKLDFKIENTYVEVKMPLQFLAFAESDCPSDMECVNSHERFVRHITELGNRLRKNENAVLLVCFAYDAPIFTPPEPTEQNRVIGDAVRQYIEAGVKVWQVNMSVTASDVKLLK